jgi:carboxyl-terminal processing protease
MPSFPRVTSLALAGAFLACGQSMPPAERTKAIDSFERVWTTIRDKHWDPKLGGLDWQAIHDEYRPRIEAAKDAAAVRELLNQMLGRLKQTHLGVFPGSVYHDLEKGAKPAGKAANEIDDATPGVDLRILDGRAIVTEVEPGSPAESQGVKVGWDLVKVDDAEVPKLIARVTEQMHGQSLIDYALRAALLRRMEGPASETVAVEFMDGADQKVALKLGRAKQRGNKMGLGNLPERHVWREWRRLPDNIGYVRLSIFLDPDGMEKTMREAIAGCRDCKGFILDVRGNPGGIAGLAMGVAGWFTDRSGLQLGTSYMRGMTLKMVIFPRPEPFRGPLAVLIDSCSVSTSEILAGGLKDIGRGRLFGTRTAAAALPSVIDRLPNGDGFQYPVANYISQGGKPLEGIGAIPDEEIRVTRRQLLEGKDPALDAARSWISKQ